MKLVDLNTAKVLYELGFNGEFSDVYLTPIDRAGKEVVLLHQYPKDKTPFTPVPRLDDAAYWIRDKYLLFIEVRISIDNKYCWGICDIVHPTNDIASGLFGLEYDTYEDALEAAVTKAIEIIKSQKQ